MSRATLIRKLKLEGMQYREVLAEVRLSQRFKGKFSLSPSEYIKTVASRV